VCVPFVIACVAALSGCGLLFDFERAEGAAPDGGPGTLDATVTMPPVEVRCEDESQETCEVVCTGDADCDDDNECTTERCNASASCERMERDGAPCGEGRCRAARCVAIGCGNGTTEGDEQCDDGNVQSGDGCESDCTWSCESDMECEDGDVCNGTAVCNVDLHRCDFGAPLLCEAPDACTRAGCDATNGCELAAIDGDFDSFTGSHESGCGDDCDDGDPSIHPGALERCDGLDNDCDTSVDEGAAPAPCYPDVDGDGFGDESGVVTACTCPPDTIALGRDCFDAGDALAASVNPAQTSFASAPWCDGAGTCSFDYDCNGVEEPRLTLHESPCNLIGTRCAGSGWRDGPPACGEGGAYAVCNPLLTVVGVRICVRAETTIVQECR
jgi:cysteine-rich repeat protein